jgi:hypothetical protein
MKKKVIHDNAAASVWTGELKLSPESFEAGLST